MNAHDDGTTAKPSVVDEADTGLPLLRTWRGVYFLVAAAFCLWVAGLLLLEWLFS